MKLDRIVMVCHPLAKSSERADVRGRLRLTHSINLAIKYSAGGHDKSVVQTRSLLKGK